MLKHMKLGAIGLAAVMLGSLMAGCTKDGAQQNSTAQPGTSQTAEVKKPDLKALISYVNYDPNTYPAVLDREKLTGYHVTYDMLPQDKPDDKLNIIMASGAEYDVIKVNKAQYSNFASQGALSEITEDMINKYAPNLKTAVSAETFESVKVNGKIYSIPARSMDNVNNSLLVRGDWLEKLNVKAPTTTEEFANMLKLFKEKDPGQLGAVNLPFTIDGSGPMIENLLGAFGIANEWNVKDGQLVARVLDPNFKEYLAFVTDLYKQGLIEKEFPTNKRANVVEKFTSGKTGVIVAGWWEYPSLPDALLKNVPTAKPVFLAPLKGKDGNAGLSMVSDIGINAIPKTSKNSEHVLRWINAGLDKENFKNLVIGTEGVDYSVKDGSYVPIQPAFNDHRLNTNNFLFGSDEKNYPAYWQARVRKDDRLLAAWQFMNEKQPTEAKKLDVMNLQVGLPEYSKNKTSLTTMVSDYAIKVILGSDTLANYDAFVTKWKAAGGEAVNKEVNAWYKTMKK